MLRTWRLWVLVFCWLGAALRFHGLFANTFHADEALFASWARLIAVWRDPILLTQAVDKPPFLFYLQALFYPLLGPVEWAARMPSLIASIISIPMTAQLARYLSGDRLASVFAAGVVAISPLAIQFSATAFSDPLLTFWLLAASAGVVAATRTKRKLAPTLAGILFGLALATKYQAILFTPLLLGLGWLSGWRGRDWWRLGLGLGIIGAGIMVWVAMRPSAGGLVAIQWVNIGGVRPAHSWELFPRLVDSARLWQLSFGWTILALGVVAGLSLFGSRSRRMRPRDASLALFILGYILLHWLWAVPVWDRYLLPVLPHVAILIGRGLSTLRPADYPLRPTALFYIALLVTFVGLHFPIAAQARAGEFPIGGRPTADGGATVVADLLKPAPYGTVLYDHWYSWHFRYQLFDGRVYVSWFAQTDALLDDLEAFAGDGQTRYIALPSSSLARPIIRRMNENGYRLQPLPPESDSQEIALYKIIVEAASE